ncbi:MAG: DNA polymerase III subunit epsilon [Rickettsiales bacterium]|jgi:DNA polymerase III subunit epsilon|nr:DNA polymerase III subunit epsilon [Rickettsiales bacterium]
MREIILDTETTGLSPKDGHRIIEIGCVEMKDKVITGNNFHVYINPQTLISESAYNVHGISNEFLEGKPVFKDIASDFLDYIGDDDLVIHNASFDMGFLNYELKILSKRPLINGVIDTLKIARSKFPGSKVNLDALCKKLDVSNAARDKHGALLDAEILAAVYVKMVTEDQNLLSFAEPKSKLDLKQASIMRINFPNRNMVIADEEVKAHKLMLEKLQNPLWNKIS